jgi:hypothetical protein
VVYKRNDGGYGLIDDIPWYIDFHKLEARKGLQNFLKKVENNAWQIEDEVIIYPSARATPSETPQNKKKFEKTWKKFLTNGFECGNISKLTARAASA